jgi:hypothetical protein
MEHLNSRIIQNKLPLSNTAAELGNVSTACELMGLSRERFYCYEAVSRHYWTSHGARRISRIAPTRPWKPRRWPWRWRAPALDHIRASNESRKAGASSPPSGVGSV